MRRRLRHPAEKLSPLLGFALILALWAGVVGLYRAVSIMEYSALWNHEPRGLMAYTRSADNRYVEAFRKAQSSALRHGWFVPDHTIRQTTGLFDLWYLRWEASPIVSINAKQAEIIVDHQRTELMTDTELECVMAHEIGHSIDYRYDRERDMNLWPYRCTDRQQFADVIGGILCGRVRYWQFMRHRIGFRVPEERPCDSSSPVM